MDWGYYVKQGGNGLGHYSQLGGGLPLHPRALGRPPDERAATRRGFDGSLRHYTSTSIRNPSQATPGPTSLSLRPGRGGGGRSGGPRRRVYFG